MLYSLKVSHREKESKLTKKNDNPRCLGEFIYSYREERIVLREEVKTSFEHEILSIKYPQQMFKSLLKMQAWCKGWKELMVRGIDLGFLFRVATWSLGSDQEQSEQRLEKTAKGRTLKQCFWCFTMYMNHLDMLLKYGV